MIRVDPDWWKTLFDDVYLLTDAPFVCNPALTKKEVDVVQQLLQLHKTDRILDLCGGQGRHALELARRGYRYLTVLDYADFLLRRGQQEALAADLPISFCRADARAVPYHSASFEVVLLMANSFGYFVDATDDRQVLAEVARVLVRGGRLLLDLIDRDTVLHRFRAESWHEAVDDLIVCWKRELSDDMVRVREVVLSKATGLLRDRTYAERLYTAERLHNMLTAMGFATVEVRRNAFVYSPDTDVDYGLATNRMLVIARKG